MAMDFPSSPTVGAIYSPVGGPVYRWDGSLWVPQGPAGTFLEKANNLSDVLSASAARTNLGLDFRGCKLTLSGGQLIPTAATTLINWNSEAFDTGGFHDNVTNNSRITIPAGVSFVELTAQSEWQGSATGAKVLSIYKNGVLVAQSLTIPGHAGANSANCSTGPLPVVAGDYFTVNVYQETGGNLTFSWSGYAWFSLKVLQ